MYKRQHYVTTEEVLEVLCRILPQSPLIKDSVIALDGSTGFTPVQYRLAELFMAYAKQVIVTVTADPEVDLYGSMGMQNLFFMSRQMAVRLSKLAEKNQVKKLPDRWVTRGKDFAVPEELDFLEKNLLRYGRSPYKGEQTGALEIYQASNLSEDVYKRQGCRRSSGNRCAECYQGYWFEGSLCRADDSGDQ